MPHGHIFGGLLRLSPLSADFSSYLVRHATDGTAGMERGLFFIQALRCSLGVADQETESYQRITRRLLLHHCSPLFYHLKACSFKHISYTNF